MLQWWNHTGRKITSKTMALVVDLNSLDFFIILSTYMYTAVHAHMYTHVVLNTSYLLLI